MWGRQDVNSILQLPIISTIQEIKKPLPWGDELRTCCGLLKRKWLVTLHWSID